MFLLALIYTFNYVDRQIVAILAQPIKDELKLSDTQLGLLSGLAFALMYSTAGISIAWLADRSNRVRIVTASCAIWSACTVLCGVAGNFLQLVLARAGVGLGEAGGVPPSYSLIADYFPPEKRGFAIACYSLGLPLGATLGMALAGGIAATYGWRSAFFAVGAPGVVLALVAFLLLREPERGRFDNLAGKPPNAPPIWTSIREFFANRTLVILLLSCAACSTAFNAFGGWAPSLLLRSKGMSMGDLSSQYSIVMGGALALGMLISGFITRKAGDNLKLYALLPAWALLLGIPFFVAGVLSPSWKSAMWLLAVPTMANVIPLAPTMAIVQNMVPATQRSVASAITLLVYNLFGTGLGPVYTGVLSDFAGPTYGVGALQVAMLAITPIFLLASITSFGLYVALNRRSKTISCPSASKAASNEL